MPVLLSQAEKRAANVADAKKVSEMTPKQIKSAAAMFGKVCLSHFD